MDEMRALRAETKDMCAELKHLRDQSRLNGEALDKLLAWAKLYEDREDE